MRLLVSGDRNWTDYDTIHQMIRGLMPDVVIHGGARGADQLAGLAAQNLGIPREVYPAEWEKYAQPGRKNPAGPIRNQRMLDEGKPDLLYAFHDDIANSKGTRDMVRRAAKAGVPFHIYQSSSVTSHAEQGGKDTST